MSAWGRTAIVDGAVRRWAAEDPEGFHRRVLSRLAGYPSGDSCWTWEGTRSAGYGRVRLPAALGVFENAKGRGAKVVVHRAVYLALVGSIPPGYVVDHDAHGRGCANRACANPAHLTAGTQRSNILNSGTPAAVQARRTHCLRGHELAGENLDPASLAAGHRNCLTCARERGRARNAAVAAAAKACGMSVARYVALCGSSRAVAESVLRQVASA